MNNGHGSEEDVRCTAKRIGSRAALPFGRTGLALHRPTSRRGGGRDGKQHEQRPDGASASDGRDGAVTSVQMK